MNCDMTFCNCHCKNTECERNMVKIVAPGFYSLADLSDTELCEGREEESC